MTEHAVETATTPVWRTQCGAIPGLERVRQPVYRALWQTCRFPLAVVQENLWRPATSAHDFAAVTR